MKRDTGKKINEEFIFIFNKLINDKSGRFLSNKEYVDDASKCGLYIDERKISINLGQIYEMSIENKIKYKIEREGKKRYKYRCVGNGLSDKDALKIGIAIKGDSTLTDKQKTRLSKEFIEKCVLPSKRNALDEKIKNSKNVFEDAPAFVIKPEISEASDNGSNIMLAIKRNKDFYCYPEEYRESLSVNEFSAYVMNIYDKDKTNPKIVCWCDDYKCVAVIHVNDLKSVRNGQRGKLDSSKAIFASGKYKEYKKWENDYFNGKIGEIKKIIVKLTYDTNDKETENICESEIASLENHYHMRRGELKVNVKKRPTKQYEAISGDPASRNHEVVDVFVEITSNIKSFKKWYIGKGHVNNVVIVEPKELNNEILLPLIKKYTNRVKKYGL